MTKTPETADVARERSRQLASPAHMTPNRGPLELSDYLRVISKRRIVILVSILAGGVLGWLFTGLAGSTYESSASILIRPVGIDLETTSLRPDQLVSLGTERELIRSGSVVNQVSEVLDGRSAETLLQNLSVDITEGTQVITIRYRAGSAENAQEGAQAFATVYLDERRGAAEQVVDTRVASLMSQLEDARDQLSDVNQELATSEEGSPAYTQAQADRELLTTRITDLQRDLTATGTVNTDPGAIITAATLPSRPSGTSARVNILIGMMAGALMAIPISFVLDRVDDRIFDASDLMTHSLPRILGIVAREKRTASSDLLNGARDSAHSEMYRRLALGLITTLNGNDATTVAIVATDDERTTHIAARLAISASDLEKKVVLVGANPDDPLSDHLPVHGSPGLAELVKGQTPNEVFQFLPELPNLLVITEGANWKTELPWHSLQPYIDGQRIKHDLLILNPASPAARAEGLRMATTAKNVVLVVEQKRTTMTEIVRSIEELTAGGARVIGFIFVEEGREAITASDRRLRLPFDPLPTADL